MAGNWPRIVAATLAVGLSATLVGAVTAAAEAATPDSTNRAILLSNKAAALMESGKFTEAARQYRAAFSMDADPDYLYSAARCEDRGGSVEAAVRDYEDYLRIAPRDHRMRIKAAEHLRRLKQLTDIAIEFTANLEAAVFVDGKIVCGITPCTRALPPGRHTVEFQAPDCQPDRKEVDVTAETRRVRGQLSEDAATITVTSTPSGLRVTIDGVEARTPVKDYRVAAGKPHGVRLADSCFVEQVENLKLAAGRHRNLAFTAEPRKATLMVKAENTLTAQPVVATVFVDDDRVGETPLKARVWACSKKVVVEHRGERRGETLALREGETKTVVVRFDGLDPPPRRASAGWLVAGGVLGVAAAGVALWAIQDDADLNAKLNDKPTGKINGISWLGATQRYNENTLRWGAAAGLATAGAVLAVVGLVKRSGEHGGEATAAVVPGEGGWRGVVAWRF